MKRADVSGLPRDFPGATGGAEAVGVVPVKNNLVESKFGYRHDLALAVQEKLSLEIECNCRHHDVAR